MSTHHSTVTMNGTLYEGLERGGKLHPLQEGFHEEHALPCGHCTPGMMMTSLALLQSKPHPTEHEIRVGIS
jgi:carbon-monoxide dehydrogenase small subunit